MYTFRPKLVNYASTSKLNGQTRLFVYDANSSLQKATFLWFYLAVPRYRDDFESDEAESVDDDGGSARGGVPVLGVTVVRVAREVRKLNLQQFKS